MPDVGGDIFQAAPAAGSIDFQSVPTNTDRDRLATNGVVRVGGIIRVQGGNYFRVLTTAPTFTDLGADIFGTGSGTRLVFANIAARDAFTPAAGDTARVLSLPYVYEFDGTVWNISEVVGNISQAFIDEVNTNGDGVVRFVDTDTGDDEADGLTRANAWRTGIRAWDELPNDDRLGVGALFGAGFFELRVFGTAALVLRPDLTRDRISSGVVATIQPDVDFLTPVELFNPLPVGARPTLPSGPTRTKAAVFEHAVGAFTTVLSDGSHWGATRSNFGGKNFHFGLLIDGDGSDNVAGDLRIVGSIDFSAGGSARLEVFALTQELGATTGIGGAFPVFRVKNVRDGLSVRVQGFKMAATVMSVDIENVPMIGCDLTHAGVGATQIRHGLGAGFAGSVFGNRTQLLSGGIQGLADLGVRGIFRAGLIIFDGRASLFGGICRVAVADGFLLHLGASAGGPGDPTAGDIDFWDFEGVGVGTELDAIRVRGVSQWRAGDSATGLTMENIDKPFAIESASRINLARVFGEFLQAGTLLSGGQATVSALRVGLLSDSINNTANVGEDVIVGDDPSIHSFLDVFNSGGKTDLALGDGSTLSAVD